jgi:hypothetical protein
MGLSPVRQAFLAGGRVAAFAFFARLPQALRGTRRDCLTGRRAGNPQLAKPKWTSALSAISRMTS